MREKGFSLIEMSIGLLIIGMMLGPFLYKYSMEIRLAETEITSSNLQTVREAIERYYMANLHYPIPAAPALNPGHSDYGKAFAGTLPALGACTTSGICREPSASSEILIGSVPFVELGLPQEKAADGWKRRITYVVTTPLTSQATFNMAIAGVYVSPKPDLQHIIIISHGRDGTGAYTVDGSRLPCTPGALDETNCDGDFRFDSLAGDDKVIFFAAPDLDYWLYIDPNAEDVEAREDTPTIGIGTSAPSDSVHLDVEGNIKALKLLAEFYCDHDGNCFDPKIISSVNKATGNGYIYCGSGTLQEISKSTGKCNTTLTAPPCTCGADEMVTGFDASGQCICGAMP